jgi:hypothetical protein
MADEKVYRVVESFSADVKGATYVLRKGDLVDAGHPVFKGREALFEEVDAAVVAQDRARRQVTAADSGGAIETATANPGAKRSRTPASKA